MSKITLNNVTTFQNDATAVNVVNGNNTTLQTAFDNTLSRDGTTPNTMSSSLDMNSNQILNLPAPTTVNSPARLIDVVSNPTIVIPVTGTSGHTVPYLDAANTWSGVNTYPANDLVLKGSSTGVTALNSANASASNFVATVPAATDTVTMNAVTQTLTNKTLTSPTITTPSISSIVNTGTLTLPVSTDTLVGRATTDTLTNKTFNSAGTGNVMQVSGVTVSSGQFPGTGIADNATAGNIGEYVTATSAGVTMTSTAIFNTTAISLTAGDWDVWGYTTFGNTGAQTFSFLQTGISTVNSVFGGQVAGGYQAVVAGGFYSLVAPMLRMSLASTTTIFLVGESIFTGGGSPVATGAMYARRVR